MAASIQLNLYATLKKYAPDGAEKYPIVPGTTVNDLIAQLNIPSDHATLVFINGKKRILKTHSRERTGLVFFRLFSADNFMEQMLSQS